ncbi:MAG TPA: S8 family serine peptidase [Rhodoglobus sp.]|nr:S8 family serine peptidase [Rhodoglobus sp.]
MTTPRSRRPLRATVSGLAAGALALTGALFAPLPAAAAPAQPGAAGPVTFDSGRYIVTLAENAVATYEGGVPGIPGTAPEEGDQLEARRAPVQDYSSYLQDRQQEVAESVGAEIESSYTLAVNAFSATLTAEQAATLAADRDVVAVSPDELKKITAVPSTSFLGLDGAGGVWEQVGGAEAAGEGVVIGVLDTGIAPENPSFAGEALGTDPSAGQPYLDGDTIVFDKNDESQFTGVCQTGEQFTADDCTTKVIGARYFIDGFGAGNIGDATVGEYVSPRDGDGHGSHTASTAAGEVGVPTAIGGIDFGTVTGVAPGARIAAYKVCWSGPDPAITDDDGCATSDLLAGIEAAVDDGVDVINYSIGGSAAETTYSVTDDAFLGAAAAGIFVAASAGNDGPGASTLDNASPWITTVAASTIPSYEATVTLGDGQAFPGASITVQEPLEGPLANSTAVAVPNATDANLCAPDSLDPALTAGQIVVCERGVYDRVAKSAEVARAGGIGMVLVNPVPGSIDTDFHSVPTVHLDVQYHDAVIAYAATEGATATLTPDNTTPVQTPVPQVAGFSSRGPVLADGSDLLKPDIAAPGVSILAAGPNAEGAEPTFRFLSGTSMAAPHIAGLAALYLGERPQAPPAEIKSAMMTTAYDTVGPGGETVTDPFAQGAGHVDPTRFFEPGLLYLNGTTDWLGYIAGLGYDTGVDPIGGSDLNLASISLGALTAPQSVTRTVTSTEAGTFEASVELPGIEAVVEPSTLTFGGPGETQSFTVTFTRTDAPLDTFTTGSLTWTSETTSVRSPIAVQPVTLVAPDSVEATGAFGSTSIEITPGGTGEIPLSTTGLVAGTRQADPDGTETEHSGSGVTGDSNEYLVEVPEGTQFSRFDLDALEDSVDVDLDLFVYQLNDAGQAVALWQSATASGDERVDIFAPPAGQYLVIVDVFLADAGAAWDLVTTNVVDGGAPITLDPAVLTAEQGVPVSYTASWADLQAQTDYVGLIRYGETGLFTVLQVEVDEVVAPGTPVSVSPPTISGEPEVGERLTADPGEWEGEGLTFAFQWQRDGIDIPGATRAEYKVKRADQGATLTVVVTATSAEGLSGTATSEGVAVKAASKTSLTLSRTVSFSWQSTTARITVQGGEATPTGTVQLTINGRTSLQPVVLDAQGRASVTLPRLGSGIYFVQAEYTGDEATSGSKSPSRVLVVIF